jgi:hypothetical protein
MIQFSATIQALLAQPVVESFYLVKIGSSLYKTSFYSDISVGGVNYVADGSILSVEPPQLVSVVDKQSFKLALADPSQALGELAEGALLGMSVEVRAGFVDQTTKLPYTDLADTLLIYKGVVDSAAYAISTSKIGSVVFNIECSSPMADLGLTRAYYTSQDYADKNLSGETAYAQIYEGAGPINLRWGKT